MKVFCIFGTRPEAVKMAPLISELRQRPADFDCTVCVTAQHRQMLNEVLTIFEITPKYDLNIMLHAQSPGYVASAVHAKLEPIISRERPDWIMIQGDTTTTMAAALSAFFHRVSIAHVEAGLRTNNKWLPFPEEINRRVTDLVSDLYFAPTARARNHLIAEGACERDVVLTGNTVIDALLDVTSRPFDVRGTPIEGIPPEGKRLILLTCHRRESFGPPLEAICRALRKIAEVYRDDIHVAYPVHPNPNVAGRAYRELANISNVTLLPHLDYVTFVHLMKRSHLILTDSGGIQEEAPSLSKPVLVLRDVTERPEAVEVGVARIVGTDETVIIQETLRLLEDSREYEQMSRVANPYGDGHASKRIADALVERSRQLP